MSGKQCDDHAVEILELERLRLREHIRIVRRHAAEQWPLGPSVQKAEKELSEVEGALIKLRGVTR